MSESKRISVTLDQKTYELLCKLEQQMCRSKSATIAAALRALAPGKVSLEFTEAETEAIFDAHAPKGIAPADSSKPRKGLGAVKGRSQRADTSLPRSGVGKVLPRSKPRP